MVDPHTDVAIAAIETDVGYFVPQSRSHITVTVTVVNGGSVPTESGTLELWRGNMPEETGVKVGELQLSSVPSHCRIPERLPLVVETGTLPVGIFHFWTRITPDDSALERDSTNNIAAGEFRRLGTGEELFHTWIPQTSK